MERSKGLLVFVKGYRVYFVYLNNIQFYFFYLFSILNLGILYQELMEYQEYQVRLVLYYYYNVDGIICNCFYCFVGVYRSMKG